MCRKHIENTNTLHTRICVFYTNVLWLCVVHKNESKFFMFVYAIVQNLKKQKLNV